jgi:hypothetical protein
VWGRPGTFPVIHGRQEAVQKADFSWFTSAPEFSYHGEQVAGVLNRMFIRVDRKRPLTLLTLYMLASAALYVALLPVVGPMANARYADWHPYHTHGPAVGSAKHLHVYEMTQAMDAHGGHGAGEGAEHHAGHAKHGGQGDSHGPHLLPSDGIGLGLSMVQMAYFGRFAPLWMKPRQSSFTPAADNTVPDGMVVPPLKHPPISPVR